SRLAGGVAANFNFAGTLGGAMSTEAAWLAFGYAVFLWSSLKLISVSVVSPDMLVAAFALLAAGVLARMQSGASGWRAFALLGVVLGCGYLAKAPMLPIGLAFVACAVPLAGFSRAGILKAAVALL